MQNKILLQKQANYGITEKVYTIIKSFLSGRYEEVVQNDETSDDHEINAIHFPRDLTSLCIFINYASGNLLGSFLNIYPDDATVFGCTAKMIKTLQTVSILTQEKYLASCFQYIINQTNIFSSLQFRRLLFSVHNQRFHSPRGSIIWTSIGSQVHSKPKQDIYNTLLNKLQKIDILYRLRKYLTPHILIHFGSLEESDQAKK